MDLSMERWERLGAAEREAVAKRVAKQLPSGFTLHGIRQHRMGEEAHHVAMYKKGDATFALVPGEAVMLGYDADRPWEPTADELESWQSTAEEYGIERTLVEFIAMLTLRPRPVELSPFLIELEAVELGWESLPEDDPGVQQILRERDQLHACRVK